MYLTLDSIYDAINDDAVASWDYATSIDDIADILNDIATMEYTSYAY